MTLSRRYSEVDPARPGVQTSWADWAQWCAQQWELYANTAYSDTLAWADFIYRGHLYRQTRSLFSPARRVVQFFAHTVYPGWLTVNPETLPNGTADAIPLLINLGTGATPVEGEEAPEGEPVEATNLRRAIGQGWQWSNWGSNKSVYVRYGAITGASFLEVVDDVEAGRVSLNVVWPEHVRDLSLDSAGNVKGYALEYELTDSGGTFLFRKEISRGQIRYYKNGKLWERDGIPAVQSLPYPFVPAAWVRHTSLGGTFGASALYGVHRLIHELNSIASHVADQIHKSIAAPIMIAGGQGVRLSGQTTVTASGTTRTRQTISGPDVRTPEQVRDQVPVVIAPTGATVQSLLGTLDLEDAIAYMDMLNRQIEKQVEVVTAWDRLREMSTVTGPAAMRLMGDVVGSVQEAQAEYDTQLIKAVQMMIAIGGYRANGNGWAQPLNRQQQAFLPYGFDSWEQGLTDFEIGPRPLIPLTPEEQINLSRQEMSLSADQAAIDAESAFRDATGGAPAA